MRSSKPRNSNSGPLMAGLVLLLAAVGGALWLLADDTPVENDAEVVVPTTVKDDTRPMDLPEPQPVVQAPVAIEVPDTILTDSEEAFEARPGTPTNAFVGRVTDERDQPVAGCELRVFKGNPLLLNVNFAGSRKVLSPRAVSGPDGSFTLAGIPAGRDYVLVGEHKDFAKTELTGLQIPSHRDQTGVILRLENGATVCGQVTTASGTPLAEARVELYDALATVQLDPDDRRPWKIIFTDGTGNFCFKHVSATSLRVRVEAVGYESQSRMLSFALEARASDRTVDFALKDGMSVPGQVVDERDRGINNVRIEATSLTKDYQGTAITHSDAGGHFLLEGMGAGQYYQVRATAKGYSNKIKPKVHVDDGNIRIEMEKRLFAEGWVVDHSGQPVRNFSLTLMRAAEGRDPLFLNDTRTFSEGDGHFVFDNLDPGSYALEARSKGFAPSWSENFAVTRSEDPAPQVTLTMGPGGTLEGTIYDGTGQAVTDALVQVNPNNHLDSPIQGIFAALGGTTQRKMKTRTGPDGRYRLSHIRAGTYQVAASHSGSAPTTVNNVQIVDDQAGNNPPLDVRLPPGATIGGMAMDSNQRIVSFCEVQVTNKKTAYLDASTTDAQGRFMFENLAAGSYTLMIKPDRIDNKPINPLMKLMYAQRSQQEIYVDAGQTVTDVELYLPIIEQN